MENEQATPEVESGEQANEAAASATPQDAPKAQSDAEKAHAAMQRRIDKLTREKHELRGQNEQLRAMTAKPASDAPAEADDVETRAEARAREIAELDAINKRCNEVAELGRKERAEFNKSWHTLSEEIGAPFDARGRPTPVMQAILDADEPHKLILHLADNPELAGELDGLSPSKLARKIVKIESEMTEKATPKPSSAPKPAQPVKPGAVASEPDPKDTAAWIKRENEKLLASRRK